MTLNAEKMTKSYLKDLVYQVTGAAIEVHKELGPGLLESVYHKCMMHELDLRGINYSSEHIVKVDYKGMPTLADLRCDLVVEDVLPVELKSVALIHPVHKAQLLTYMKLLQLPKGLLINFNCENIVKEGHFSLVNQLFYEIPNN
jgi:GxxExxY protein